MQLLLVKGKGKYTEEIKLQRQLVRQQRLEVQLQESSIQFAPTERRGAHSTLNHYEKQVRFFPEEGAPIPSNRMGAPKSSLKQTSSQFDITQFTHRNQPFLNTADRRQPLWQQDLTHQSLRNLLLKEEAGIGSDRSSQSPNEEQSISLSQFVRLQLFNKITKIIELGEQLKDEDSLLLKGSNFFPSPQVS